MAVVAVGAKLVRRGAVPLDERTGGDADVCCRVCTCREIYFTLSNTVRAHVVTVLSAVSRVADKRARIGMMMIFFGRVNGTVTSEWGVLYGHMYGRAERDGRGALLTG